jgi:AraC-like DNA-binding protein
VTLSPHQFADLSDEIADRLGAPGFGLDCAGALPRGGLGLTEYLVRTAATLHGALLAITRYAPLLNDAAIFRLQVGRGSARLEHAMPGSPGVLGRQGNEFTVAVVLATLRSELGATLEPEGVDLCHPTGRRGELLRKRLAVRRVEENDHNAICLDARRLQEPMRGADPTLHAILSVQAEAALGARPPADHLIWRVEEAARALLAEGELTGSGVAAAMGLGLRRLQRALEAEGTTLRTILEAVRFERAKVLLADPALSLTEIARAVGYADPRVLRRAFRRWEGISPQEHRRVWARRHQR